VTAPDGIRINRYLAMCGLGARRAVERLVSGGHVAVNGETVTDLAFRVARGAVVSVDGRKVTARRRYRYVAFYKPRGVLTTSRDRFRRRTVLDVLPPLLRSLKPVGRLDADTEGLLLLTDDGAWAHRVAHPSFGVVKKYLVEVEGRVTAREREALEQGIELRDGHLGKVEVERIAVRKGASFVRVAAAYGRKRMIRQMFGALGHRIRTLRRVAVGPVRAGDLRPGEWRELSRREVEALRG
jgi:23S rRNA pseudouridine2605 synthase